MVKSSLPPLGVPANPWDFFLKCALLGLLLSLTLSSDAHACLNRAHEWTLISSTPNRESPGFFGLSDAFSQFRSKLDEQLAYSGKASGPVSLVFLSWGPETEKPANADQLSRAAEAFSLAWPAGRMVVSTGSMDIRGDPESVASRARLVATPYSAVINVLKNDAQQLDFLDLVFFAYGAIREVFKEETRIQAKVLDRNGEIVFIGEIGVSPTIIHDLTFYPGFPFFSYFEKHDSIPRILDFGELYQEIASQSFESRPEGMRLPDLPTSAPMAPPAGNATAPAETGR